MSFPVIPTYEELKEMSTTHTVDMVADEYGVTTRTAYYWFQKNDLRPVPKPHGGRKKADLSLEYIIKCVERGIPLGDIASMCHVCKQTVSAKLKEAGTSYKEIQMGGKIEHGIGHVCRPKGAHDCKYWNVGVGCCDYLCMVGHSRPCPPNACTAYEKGRHPKTYELEGSKDMYF